LDAVINEALRLHPAAPASLPRITPKGGHNLGSHRIPENVRAVSKRNTRSLHRQSLATDHPFRAKLHGTARSIRVQRSRALRPREMAARSFHSRYERTLHAFLQRRKSLSREKSCADRAEASDVGFATSVRCSSCDWDFERRHGDARPATIS
jgi:hypothetical protein